MGRLHTNNKLLLDILQAPFLVLHFSYYTLMTLLMMLPVLLLSILMILVSSLSVIRHLICGSNNGWLLNLNLTFGNLWGCGRSCFQISVLGKKLVSFERSNNTGATDMKVDESVLEEKLSLKMLGLTFSSRLD